MITKQEAYDAGYDYGINGANTDNCSIEYFATPELTKEWELGKYEAEHPLSPPKTIRQAEYKRVAPNGDISYE